MANVVLTNEQFAELMSRISVAGNSTQGVAPARNCSSRFDGSDVNAFIDAISIYKDCVQVSDANALKRLPMLFDDFAAKWYQGVKSTVNTWDEALALLRTTFGPQKPPHRVYRELFAQEQDSETPTDIFICKMRSILAQFPSGTLNETVQLDMVYGLLNRRIREKLPRDQVKTFNELLQNSRLIEETFERKIVSKDFKDTQKRARCQYCKNMGHTKDECRKLENRTSSTNTTKPAGGPPLSCYGCGKPGYIRSNCPTCSSTEMASMEFFSMDTLIAPRSRPIIHVNILGHQGQGLIDTAAKQSIAGKTLYDILKREGQEFPKEHIMVKFADGQGRIENVLVTKVDVKVKDRRVPTKFIIFPDAPNKTLFGIDFIHDAKLILDVHNKEWYFSDEKSIRYELIFESATKVSEIASCSTPKRENCEKLRTDEGTMLTNDQRYRLNVFLNNHENIFSLGGEPTPYAEHHINTGDHPPIALPPYRMSPAKKSMLKAELDRLLAEGIIEECESPWAAPVVLVPKKEVEFGCAWTISA
ncbi:uncharacterized protein LOC123322348 [Coccinella septempunctata]|uniref:uncharacterized protein LOC123322348 n=1 Tax=Coccinella septempunctata TaxID=41139 RepID=UPI001D089DB6|nr:uncharacterized protein LOC123322348 [Coccinella septempunctata]